MSIECLNKALKVHGLTPTKKLVLIILANYADENKSCYPSYGHIAKIVGLKDSKNIKRIIDELIDNGLLRKESRVNKDGGYTSNKYYLTLGGNETPMGVDAPSLWVSPPPNTKDNTKEIYTHDFEDFWKIYPRKLGKHQAFKIFSKIAVEDLDKVIKATQVFRQKNITTEEKYIPHASTYLNQKRYEDYYGVSIKTNSLNNIAG